ncbi:endothelial lipase-like isoform X2 [Periplaneta americana]|uniref:endothelial lipase-like isoform X2 n=1 Tax=Periplaneta americana TaxID=6978 RepID=UPI0037E96053
MDLYIIFMSLLRMIVPGVPQNNGTTVPSSPIPGLPICIYAQKVCPNPDVTFYLYTTEHPEPRLLDLNYPDNITSSLFMMDSPFKLLLHGYGENYTLTANSVLRSVYLSSGNYNVIVASYGALVPDGCYIHGTINLPVIANCTAQLIDFLVKKMKVPLQNIHVIGFSLGAQVAGQAGNFMTVGKLKRITDLTCSHFRAPMYFAESITTQTGFWGYQCSQKMHAIAFPFLCDYDYNAIMGEYANSSARGIYRVDTNGKSPYAIGKHRISPLNELH